MLCGTFAQCNRMPLKSKVNQQSWFWFLVLGTMLEESSKRGLRNVSQSFEKFQDLLNQVNEDMEKVQNVIHEIHHNMKE